MIQLSLAAGRTPKVLAVAVYAAPDDASATGEGSPPRLASGLRDLEPLGDELVAFLRQVEYGGAAGSVQVLPRPGRHPHTVIALGVGAGTEADWRSAGAALSRTAAAAWPSVQVRLPSESGQAGAFAEGALLASYRFSLASAASAPKLRRITVEPADDRAREAVQAALDRARVLAEAVALARDLTNTPSLRKSPKWFADKISAAAARRRGVSVTVWDKDQLQADGFGGILAVGGGSSRPPRLLQLAWHPRAAGTHVALVGKGITFDTGGYSIKPAEAMRLMRKDMGGAAAVCATVLAAADLGLPVRVTALAPLAENMISGSAFRPGDVVRHYGGRTSEIYNTDAEGRVVLADALTYAAQRLRPDVLIDLATLTGASHVALGKRMAALLTPDDDLAAALAHAGEQAGEPMWRLPLADEYAGLLRSDVADLNNAPGPGEAGVITAALYLREFTGPLRQRWAHVDMSGPAWLDGQDGPLVKGATGWGVRMLVRWLQHLG